MLNTKLQQHLSCFSRIEKYGQKDGQTAVIFAYMPSRHPGHANNAYNLLNDELFNNTDKQGPLTSLRLPPVGKHPSTRAYQQTSI
jgi:hypothetical protein